MRYDRGGERVVGSVQRIATPRRWRIAAFALGAMLALSSACATNSANRKSEDPEDAVGPTRVLVENQGFSDMNIFVYRSSQRVRLGMAGGNGRTTLIIPSSLMFGATSLRFVAEPIGGTRASVSLETLVAPGDMITITIPPN